MRQHRLTLPQIALVAAAGFAAGVAVPIVYRLIRKRAEVREMPEMVDGMMFAHEVPIIIAEVME